MKLNSCLFFVWFLAITTSALSLAQPLRQQKQACVIPIYIKVLPNSEYDTNFTTFALVNKLNSKNEYFSYHMGPSSPIFCNQKMVFKNGTLEILNDNTDPDFVVSGTVYFNSQRRWNEYFKYVQDYSITLNVYRYIRDIDPAHSLSKTINQGPLKISTKSKKGIVCSYDDSCLYDFNTSLIEDLAAEAADSLSF